LRKGYQRDIYGVEHYLNAHDYLDDVPLGQYAKQADTEKYRR
jgi:hypothetical protein